MKIFDNMLFARIKRNFIDKSFSETIFKNEFFSKSIMSRLDDVLMWTALRPFVEVASPQICPAVPFSTRSC
jgi:hypothetical protein